MKNLYGVSFVGILLLVGLTSCTDHYIANVSLNDAMTQYGRINSNDLRLGNVLLWHPKTNEINTFASIPTANLSLERTPLSGTQDEVSIQGISESDITVTTPAFSNLGPLGDKATIGIKAAVGSKVSLELDKYYLEHYDGQYALPNDPSTLTWRQQNLKAKLVDPDLIFVFVVADATCDQAQFYSGTPTDDKGNPKALDNSLTIGGSKLIDVSYTGGSTIQRKGSGIPAIVKYKYYHLKSDTEGATGFHFERIHDTSIDAQFANALRANGID